jgi:hypothetical protein
MSQLNASLPVILSVDIHIGTEHECKWEVDPAAFNDPRSFAAETFDGLIEPFGESPDFLESALYLDDVTGSLARAGHSLSVIVNSGVPSGTCVIACKQTLHHRGWRDALEVRQRISHHDLDTRLRDTGTLPIDHLRGLGLITGNLEPAGVGVQRRFKRHGHTADGTEVFCSLDDVHFGDSASVKKGRHRYTCLEIEVNSSSPVALADLDRLAKELDSRLGVPRDAVGKSQRAWTVHIERRRDGQH